MIFGKKKKEVEIKGDSVPRGINKTIPRPTEDDIEKTKKSIESMRNSRVSDPKVDVYFVQEISDRLYGPDSDEYIKAIKKLNEKFRPRVGKTGVDLYDPEVYDKVRDREKDIIGKIVDDTHKNEEGE